MPMGLSAEELRRGDNSSVEPLGSQGCCSFVAHSAETAPCGAGGGLLPLGSGYDFLADP